MASDRFVYTIKRKLHGGLKICILFSRVKNNILLAVLVHKILFLPLEIKMHIFALPCYILYVISTERFSIAIECRNIKT